MSGERNKNDVQIKISDCPNKSVESDSDAVIVSYYQYPKLRCVHLFCIFMWLLFSFSIWLLLNNNLLIVFNLKDITEHYALERDLTEQCQMQLVESIPEHLNFSENSPSFMSTYQAWKLLLNTTKVTLDIGSFYWTLRGEDVVDDPTAAQGEDIFKNLMELGLGGKAKIRIAQSIPTAKESDYDTQVLSQNGAAMVRSLNFSRLLGGGVLHTKFWISDTKHIYLGSANMDWRSLTQVKELGIIVMNCPTMARDLSKIFEEYWFLSTNDSVIPKQWPSQYSTAYNFNNPMILNINNTYKQLAILSSSPPPLTATGRVDDLDAILTAIKKAESFINIAVMDYYPLILYADNKKYWPHIDNALREAAINRKVNIKLLISWWRYSSDTEDYFLRSLKDISNSMPDVDVQIKRFVVPANEKELLIPYGRVNHNKYMVTDNVAYIGTSNWSGDYFSNTAGVGLVLPAEMNRKEFSSIHTDLLSVFQRDWNSSYARDFGKK